MIYQECAMFLQLSRMYGYGSAYNGDVYREAGAGKQLIYSCSAQSRL